MRPNLHQRNPPIRIIARPRIKLGLSLPGKTVSITSGVPVGAAEGRIVGVREGVAEAVCVGKAVDVGGGVTRRSNLFPARITESAESPFHIIRSANETAYSPAIPESVSPLWMVW